MRDGCHVPFAAPAAAPLQAVADELFTPAAPPPPPPAAAVEDALTPLLANAEAPSTSEPPAPYSAAAAPAVLSRPSDHLFDR
jgi:hypothetical protein